MKKLSIILIVIFLSCTKNSAGNCNDKVRETESIGISKAILHFVNNDSINLNLPFCNSLQRLNIRTDLHNASKNNSPVIIEEKINSNSTRDVFIEKLLSAKINEHFFFSKTDSLSFINQNCTTTFKLPETTLQNRKTIDLDKIGNNLSIEYVKISYPIFSSDNKKAYLEIDVYSKESKYGNSLYLEKVGSTWKIIDIQGLWDI